MPVSQSFRLAGRGLETAIVSIGFNSHVNHDLLSPNRPISAYDSCKLKALVVVEGSTLRTDKRASSAHVGTLEALWICPLRNGESVF